jgi:hypothetical protein
MRTGMPTLIAAALLLPAALPFQGAAAQSGTPQRAAPQSAAPLSAGPAPRLVIGAPGSCTMKVNGDSRPCTSGLIYVQNAEGVILISVQSGRDVTIGFQVARDRQPKLEEYVAELSRMHTSISGRTAAKEVTGTCEISMTADGQTWHRATCRATDRSGIVTEVVFTGDGRQVSAARPGQEGQGGGGQPAAPRRPPG